MAILNKLILLLFFAVLSFNANSATISDFVTGTFSARNISAIKRSTGRELVANFDFKALSKKTGRPANWPKTVKIGKNGVASLIKRAASSPWGAAITVAITAAGYVLDNNDVLQASSGYTGTGYCSFNGQQMTASDCIYEGEVVRGFCPSGGCLKMFLDSGGNWYNINNFDNTQNYGSWDPPSGVTIQNPEGGTVSVSDSDLYDSVVPRVSDSELKRIFKNSDTGQLDFPGLNEVKNDLKNDIVAANDNDPATNPTVSNSWQLVTGTQDTYYIDNGVSNQLTQITDESKNICETNPTSLACIEVGEPDNPSIPESSINFQIDRVQYFGNAQCPSPRTVTVMGQVITLSFDSVCSVAIGVKPIILLFSVFVAMSIVAGTVRSGVID